MANSSIITEIKNKVITEIVNDEAFFYAINSSEIASPAEAASLINTHLFSYHLNPETLNKAITYLTLQVNITKQDKFKSDDLWINPSLEIGIISHTSRMDVDNLPAVSANRNDYIAQLLDKKFNGRTSLGMETDADKLILLGKLDLIESTEGALAPDYLYRKLIFITKDINNSICGSR